MNDMDLSQYMIKKDPQEKGGEINSDDNSSRFEREEVDLERYRSKPTETGLQQAGRTALRAGSRAAETVLGLPGDILRTAESAILGGAEKLTGKDLSGIRKGIRETAPFKVLPGSEDLRKTQSELTGGYTDPKPDTWEETADDTVKLVSSLYTGGSGLLRSMSAALLGAGAKKTAKELGAGDTGQLGAELAGVFLMHNINPGVANRTKDMLYNAADAAIIPGTMLPSTSYTQRLDALEQTLLKGAPTSTKDAVLKDLRYLRNRASGGVVEAQELTQAYRDLGQNMSAKDLYEGLSASSKILARQQYESLKDTIRDTFKDYSQYNPDFYKYWTSANAANTAIQKSLSKRSWIKSKISRVPEKLIGTAAFEAIYGYPEAAAGTLAAGAAGVTGLRAWETADRFIKSPILRKYYIKAMKDAAAKNFPAMIRGIEKLDNLDKKNQKHEMLTG